MTKTAQPITVSLASLALSPLNVRTVSPANIAAFADDIAAHGLIQTLGVYKEGKTYQVFAGGRRLRALQLLAEDGRIAADYSVPVMVRSKKEAVELSLAENASREDMHVADAVIAYGRLRTELQFEPEDIAARFGVSVDYVRKVLKLSALAPECLAALAANEIGMNAAQALTLTDDHDVQRTLMLEHGNAPHQIKRALSTDKIPTSSSLFTFVGYEAYTAAGGTITADLFSEDGEGLADDPMLVSDLAAARLNAFKQEREGEGWKNVYVHTQRPVDYWMKPHYDDDEFTDEVKAEAPLHIFIGYDGELCETAYRSAKTTKAKAKSGDAPDSARG